MATRALLPSGPSADPGMTVSGGAVDGIGTPRASTIAPLDASRLAELADSLAPPLYRFARSLTRSAEQADEAVQQTFVRAFERRAQFAGGSVEAWLRRILHNLLVDQARHGRFEVAASEEELAVQVERSWRDDTYSVDPEAVLERAQDRDALEDALSRLPYTYRSVVVLHDQEGWTVPEIAATFEVGLPAAKQRLRRGRMMLVSALEEAEPRRRATGGLPMRCWDARLAVSDYLDGELPAEQRHSLEAHLEGCPTCPPLYAGLVGTRAELGGLRDPDSVIPPDLARRAAERLEAAGAAEPG